MKKIMKSFICLVLISTLPSGVGIWKDKQLLKDNVIRLHVVANSDALEDQKIKLKVKDAVIAYLQPLTERFDGKEEAMQFIWDNLQTLQELSNKVLDSLGVADKVAVSFQQEPFPMRSYDTFSLPSGIYDALRIEIGEAKGKNWWCVVFPSLCLPATTNDFRETAVGSGFSSSLSNTLSGSGGYKLRFYVLDWIGQLENLFR